MQFQSVEAIKSSKKDDHDEQRTANTRANIQTNRNEENVEKERENSAYLSQNSFKYFLQTQKVRVESQLEEQSRRTYKKVEADVESSPICSIHQNQVSGKNKEMEIGESARIYEHTLSSCWFQLPEASSSKISKLQSQNSEEDMNINQQDFFAYQNFVNKVKKIPIPQDLQKRLSQNKIKRVLCDYSDIYSDLSIVVIEDYQPDYSFVQYSVFISIFKIQVFVKHIQEKCLQIQAKQYVAKGGFGSIYCLKQNGVKYAVKQIFFDDPKGKNYHSKKQLIEHAVTQYAFCKLASSLRIGPFIDGKNLIDLECYSNCIQFRMQYCQNQYDNPLTEKKFSDQLSQNICLLHQFHIVHRDIKPANCLYSPKFNRFVFVDFGLAQSVIQTPQRPSFCYYGGTVAFMSPAMRKLQYTTKGIVNLYYNDVFAMEKTILEEKKSKHLKNKLYFFEAKIDQIQEFQLLVQRTKTEYFQKNVTRQNIIDSIEPKLQTINSFNLLKNLIMKLQISDDESLRRIKSSLKSIKQINLLEQIKQILIKQNQIIDDQSKKELSSYINELLSNFRHISSNLIQLDQTKHLRTLQFELRIYGLYTKLTEQWKQILNQKVDPTKRFIFQRYIQQEQQNLYFFGTIKEIAKYYVEPGSYKQAKKAFIVKFETIQLNQNYSIYNKILILQWILNILIKFGQNNNEQGQFYWKKLDHIIKQNSSQFNPKQYQKQQLILEIYSKRIRQNSKQKILSSIIKDKISNYIKKYQQNLDIQDDIQKFASTLQYLNFQSKYVADLFSQQLEYRERKQIQSNSLLHKIKIFQIKKQLSLLLPSSDEKTFKITKEAYQLSLEIFPSHKREFMGVFGLIEQLMGYCKMIRNQYKQACNHYQKCLEICLRVGSRFTSIYSKTVNNIGYLKTCLGQYSEAIKFRLQSVEIREKSHGLKTKQYAIALQSLGYSYEAYGKIDIALTLFKKTDQILKDLPQTVDITEKRIVFYIYCLIPIYSEQAQHQECFKLIDFLRDLQYKTKIQFQKHQAMLIDIYDLYVKQKYCQTISQINELFKRKLHIHLKWKLSLLKLKIFYYQYKFDVPESIEEDQKGLLESFVESEKLQYNSYIKYLNYLALYKFKKQGNLQTQTCQTCLKSLKTSENNTQKGRVFSTMAQIEYNKGEINKARKHLQESNKCLQEQKGQIKNYITLQNQELWQRLHTNPSDAINNIG